MGLRRCVALVTSLLVFALPAGAGEDPWALCPPWPGPSLPPGPDAHLSLADAPLRITADSIDGSRDSESSFSGNALLQHGPRSLVADDLYYRHDGNTMRAEGRVRYGDGNLEVESARALFDLDPGMVRFDDVEFRLLERRALGSADSLEAVRDEPVVVTGVRFTTCPAGDDSWQLHAPSIRLDPEAGMGTGRNVRVVFKGVPIFYTPWITFPLTDARKSGFLAPDVGSSSRTGFELRVPWYWNIAPNMDATFTPRLIEQRGVQLVTEYRYLNPGSQGVLDLETLPDDRVIGEHRGRVSWRHRSAPAPGWQFRADFNHVTDPDYFADFGDSLSATAVTHQRRMAEISVHGERHGFTGRLDGYQTLDREIPEPDRPYARLPQLVWHGTIPGPVGMQARIDSEFVSFAGGDRVTGERLDLQPSIGLALGGAGWFVEPRAAYRHTRYWLEDAPAGAESRPSRSLPVLSVDGGLVFERPAGERTQTLEPRAYYLRVPFRDQSSLPLFDTSEPDFNIIQLYRDNRFNGADRVGDADQLSLGIGSRLYGPAGEEQLAFQVGRIRHFDERAVTLPGEAASGRSWSDVVAEAHARVTPHWSARLGLQWDPDSGEVTRNAIAVRWAPGRGRTVNLGWRNRRDEVDQSDLSFIWPLNDRWGLIGRWHYSYRDSQNLETIFGVEYQSCCWAMQLVSREYIATRDGDTNRSIYLQLELKGLANIGRGIDDTLGRDRLRY